MYYGIYQSVRDSAWQCLLDFDIACLPVDVLSVARRMGVRVIRNSTVGELLPNENGKAYFDGVHWIIIYNDQNTAEMSRFTIAHELGHILLGHELAHARYAQIEEFAHKPKAEQQADTFALRLLCPACVLWELGVTAPEEIASVCRISKSSAQKRARRLSALAKRNCFLSSPLERAVREQFSAYMAQRMEELAKKNE